MITTVGGSSATATATDHESWEVEESSDLSVEEHAKASTDQD